MMKRTSKKMMLEAAEQAIEKGIKVTAFKIEQPGKLCKSGKERSKTVTTHSTKYPKKISKPTLPVSGSATGRNMLKMVKGAWAWVF
jgi:hypothetical protein